MKTLLQILLLTFSFKGHALSQLRLSSMTGTFEAGVPITMEIDLPFTLSDQNEATFTDYRFDVVVSHSLSGLYYIVPMVFAGGERGTLVKGRVALPNLMGQWIFAVSAIRGPNVATARSIRDLIQEYTQNSNRFRYIPGIHLASATIPFLQNLRPDNPGRVSVFGRTLIDGHGRPFIERIQGSPENFFANPAMTGTDTYYQDCGGLVENFLHDYRPAHLDDWDEGDEDFSGLGLDPEDVNHLKAMIGFTNYTKSVGANGQYMLLQNMGPDPSGPRPGDGMDFSFNRFEADCSVNPATFDTKRAEIVWRVLQHISEKNHMMAQMLVYEEENEFLFSPEMRRLYIRYVTALFVNGLTHVRLVLGEENHIAGPTLITENLRALSEEILYGTPLGLHTTPLQSGNRSYDPIESIWSATGPHSIANVLDLQVRVDRPRASPGPGTLHTRYVLDRFNNFVDPRNPIPKPNNLLMTCSEHGPAAQGIYWDLDDLYRYDWLVCLFNGAFSIGSYAGYHRNTGKPGDLILDDAEEATITRALRLMKTASDLLERFDFAKTVPKHDLMLQGPRADALVKGEDLYLIYTLDSQSNHQSRFQLGSNGGCQYRKSVYNPFNGNQLYQTTLSGDRQVTLEASNVGRAPRIYAFEKINSANCP